MNKKIKLVHVQLLPLLAGAQTMMFNLIDSLDRDKYDITVISKPGGILVEKIKEKGYNYLAVPSLRRNVSLLDIVALIHLYIIFKKHRFDIVHTHSSKTGFLGRIAARLAGIKKIIHTAHGFPFHEHQSLFARKLYRALEKLASFFCDKIVVVNNFEREAAIASGLISAEKLITIYNGVKLPDNAKERTYPREGLTTYKHLTDAQSPFVIGTVARFTAAKNIVNLTRIAIEVCQKIDDIVFVFVGDGELFEECRKLVNDNKLQRRIIMPGWQENVKEWLDNMHVYLLFSLWEGLSLSILEAMASGLPVIASDIKGNNELINKENGILIDVRDKEKLVETLISLPDRNEELNRWSKNTLKRVREKFSHESFVRGYIELYER